jgi:hypothetical protein
LLSWGNSSNSLVGFLYTSSHVDFNVNYQFLLLHLTWTCTNNICCKFPQSFIKGQFFPSLYFSYSYQMSCMNWDLFLLSDRVSPCNFALLPHLISHGYIHCIVTFVVLAVLLLHSSLCVWLLLYGFHAIFFNWCYYIMLRMYPLNFLFTFLNSSSVYHLMHLTCIPYIITCLPYFSLFLVSLAIVSFTVFSSVYSWLLIAYSYAHIHPLTLSLQNIVLQQYLMFSLSTWRLVLLLLEHIHLHFHCSFLIALLFPL